LIPWNLQLFAAEDEGRTEDPTGKKISKARGEGQVVKSAEITTALSLLFSSAMIVLFLPYIVGYQMRHLRYFFENLATLELTQESLQVHLLQTSFHVLAVLWPIILTVVIVAIGSNVAQFGWLFTWKPLHPKWNKIFPNPKKLIDRLLIGKTMAFNLFKSLMKLIAISIIAWSVLEQRLVELMALWKMAPYSITELVVDLCFELIWKIFLFLAVIAAIDYAFNRHQWKDSLKMAKHEVKDEAKQAEGDPIIKQAQRRRMMEMFRRRMMREIPTADVVITNPTHISIAIKYDQAMMIAPRVVAKGEGNLAFKIREVAKLHGIPLYENKPLAQAMYKAVEIGQEVPPQFYQAVAEVLAYVYRLKKKAS
jgi:flagellar biosynthetic protein FlhB